MDPITIGLIISAATFTYKMLDLWVFAPDRSAHGEKSVFNFTDFPRPRDKYNRMCQSIFTPLVGLMNDGRTEWWDRVLSYIGNNGELLHGYTDTLPSIGLQHHAKFNADSLFGLYAFLCYWYSTDKANEIFFHHIMNPMFNHGLQTDTGAMTNNRFTTSSVRWYWLYDDFLKLKAIAAADAGKVSFNVYTNGRNDAHSLDAKPYATALLNILQNYPFTSGYFIDGLTDPYEIMKREVDLNADIMAHANAPTSAESEEQRRERLAREAAKAEADRLAAEAAAKNKSLTNKTTTNTIIEKVIIAVIASAIIIFIVEIFKHFKSKKS